MTEIYRLASGPLRKHPYIFEFPILIEMLHTTTAVDHDAISSRQGGDGTGLEETADAATRSSDEIDEGKRIHRRR
jgi:hypothetical protein